MDEICDWCGAPMRDIGQGGPGITEARPAWLRLFHCTRCDHETTVVVTEGDAHA